MGLALVLGAPSLVAFLVITAMGACMMVCATIFSIQMLAFVQAQSPPDMVGKIVSFVMAVSMCSQPFGQAIYGMLFERFANHCGLVVLATALASIAVALYSKSAFRRLAPARSAA